MARRSKYKFASLAKGDVITVEPIDVYAMRNSLAGFNKRNKTAIRLSNIGEPDSTGNYTFTRIA